MYLQMTHNVVLPAGQSIELDSDTDTEIDARSESAGDQSPGVGKLYSHTGSEIDMTYDILYEQFIFRSWQS